MLVVSDTSPLLALSNLGMIFLLAEQFGKIHIPTAVLKEMHAPSRNHSPSCFGQAIKDEVVVVLSLRNRALALSLQAELDVGESEAIALSLEQSANWLLMDERKGRQVASRLGLKVTGTIGVLLKAKKSGSISSIEHPLKTLRDNFGFFVSDVFLQQIMRECGETSTF